MEGAGWVRGALVEDVAQPGFFLAVVAAMVFAVVGVFKVWPALGVGVLLLRVGGCRCGLLYRGWGLVGCQLHQLVELTPIQPDAAAAGAVVDLHALPVGHQQGAVGTHGTFHLSFP